MISNFYHIFFILCNKAANEKKNALTLSYGKLLMLLKHNTQYNDVILFIRVKKYTMDTLILL